MAEISKNNYDVVVIGAGGSGLAFALFLSVLKEEIKKLITNTY